MAFDDKALIEIEAHMKFIKKNARCAIYSNYFKPKIYQAFLPTEVNDEAIVFMDRDTDFHRLYYYAVSLSNLSDILRSVRVSPVVVDILSKVQTEDIEKVFYDGGFKKYAVLTRMINNSLRKFPRVEPLYYANEKEWQVIIDVLNIGLDRYTGHFPQQAELIDLIRDKKVIVAKKENTITGLIMYQVMGKQCHFYQWYSAKENDASDGANLLINLYAVLDELGIRKGYLWVNDDNAPVMKIHQRFGFKPDGLKDFIYFKQVGE